MGLELTCFRTWTWSSWHTSTWVGGLKAVPKPRISQRQPETLVALPSMSRARVSRSDSTAGWPIVISSATLSRPRRGPLIKPVFRARLALSKAQSGERQQNGPPLEQAKQGGGKRHRVSNAKSGREWRERELGIRQCARGFRACRWDWREGIRTFS